MTDKKTLKRIHSLIKDIQRTPHEGIGKPEALKHHLSGYWSRRITEEHRIIYKEFEHGITFVQMRYHYKYGSRTPGAQKNDMEASDLWYSIVEQNKKFDKSMK